MGFLAYGTEAHRARHETFYYFGSGLDLAYGYRLRLLEFQEAAQSAKVVFLVIDEAAELLEGFEIVIADRILQGGYRFGVPQVELAVAAPLVKAAVIELGLPSRPGRERFVVSGYGLLRYHVQAHTAYPGDRTGKAFVYNLAVQAERLEYLCAAVALYRRDAHL